MSDIREPVVTAEHCHSTAGCTNDSPCLCNCRQCRHVRLEERPSVPGRAPLVDHPAPERVTLQWRPAALGFPFSFESYEDGIGAKLVDYVRADTAADERARLVRAATHLAYLHAAEVVANAFPTSDAMSRLRDLAADYATDRGAE